LKELIKKAKEKPETIKIGAFCGVRKSSKEAGLRRGWRSLYPRVDSYLGPVWIEGLRENGKFTPWG
jgi:hypothetical protein